MGRSGEQGERAEVTEGSVGERKQVGARGGVSVGAVPLESDLKDCEGWWLRVCRGLRFRACGQDLVPVCSAWRLRTSSGGGFC